ncbi:ASCH domain-containing protein [Streptomyces sp. NPDC056296]|uniref:ASCH domain-containing protein n=1 Tax=Streptomyces sp. NPDC056296 TaxID=3345775 RepID=UPI0035E21341
MTEPATRSASPVIASTAHARELDLCRKYFDLIAAGTKTIEMRKGSPGHPCHRNHIAYRKSLDQRPYNFNPTWSTIHRCASPSMAK